MEVAQLLQTIVQFLCATIMWVSVGLLLLKTLWNLGVPYAIIHEALKRPQDKHGWSMFILIDVAMLVMAFIASAFAGQQGILRPQKIAIYGVVAIITSYVHIVVVLLVGGYIFGLFRKPGQEEPHVQE